MLHRLDNDNTAATTTMIIREEMRIRHEAEYPVGGGAEDF